MRFRAKLRLNLGPDLRIGIHPRLKPARRKLDRDQTAMYGVVTLGIEQVRVEIEHLHARDYRSCRMKANDLLRARGSRNVPEISRAKEAPEIIMFVPSVEISHCPPNCLYGLSSSGLARRHPEANEREQRT